MKISVYITSYNKGKYLSEAIESVLQQTLKPYEIIIVDDASSDNSQDIIKSYANTYSELITPIFNEKNFGVSYCRNKALESITGDLVTYLDGDDYYYLNKLENESKYLINNKQFQAVYSNFNYIDASGGALGKFSEDLDKPVEGNIFLDTFVRKYNVSSGNNYIYEMFYKTCLENFSLYDENINLWEDWDFRIRMSKMFRYGYCSKVNSVYRQLPDSLHTLNFETHFHEQIKIYNKNKPLIQDLKEEEASQIHNSVYSKIKSIFVGIIDKNSQNKLLFNTIYYGVHFILTFRTKKSISFVLRNLIKDKK